MIFMRRGQTSMATMNISLPDSLKSFVEAQVAEGGYGSASEYFRELVRDARKRKTEQHLEALLLEGLEGEGVPATPEFWNGLRSRVRARHPETE
jgi:antitoxin ParD1/3/4